MKKDDERERLAHDVQKFLANGGEITECKIRTTPISFRETIKNSKSNGRPKVDNTALLRRAQQLLDGGMSRSQVAKEVGKSTSWLAMNKVKRGNV